MSQELIVGLTEHRTLGHIFQAFLIEKRVSFFSIVKLVKQRDIESLGLSEKEAQLVKSIEQYSDEKLVQKFTKSKEASKFFQQMDSHLFNNHVSPYIDKYMNQVIRILMNNNVRLFYKQAKYSNLYDEDLIVIPDSFTECVFHFEKQEEGTKYSISLSHDNKLLKLTHRNITLVTNDPCSFVWQNKLYVFEKLNAKRLLPFFEKEAVFIPRKVETKYYKSFVLNIIREHNVNVSGFTVSEGEIQPQAILSLEPDLKMEAVFIPKFLYGETEYLPNLRTEVIVRLHQEEESYHFTKIKRDRKWENQQLQFLEKIGLQETNGSYIPKGTELLERNDRLYELINWLNENKPLLINAGFHLKQSQYESKYSTDKQAIEMQIKTSDDWFDIYSHVSFGEFQIPFIKLKKHILNSIREFELPNGEVAILPKEWFSDYHDIMAYTKTDGNKLKLNKFHAFLVPKRFKGIDRDFLQRLQDIGKNASEQVIVPANMKASLRSYQHTGFSWLYHLYEHQFGGCLADDMGLGKTIQTLTLLLKLKRLKRITLLPDFSDELQQGNLFSNKEHPDKDIQPATLIVMPTSLLHNWENEIRKFTPSLKVYRHFGQQRNRTSGFGKLIQVYDIILTTYGMVRNDFELFRQHRFFYLILDESQNIKNPNSKTYKSITQLKADHRLVLTGTPIENSLSDLWSQINFINKGLLGNLAFFKREFITPIEKKNDIEKQEKLQTLIRPFVLRRTKEQVAKDLPPLTEQIRYCQMDSDQKSLYETEKSAIRNSILDSIEKEGMEKSSFMVLHGLTKLRQLANHPSMLHEDNTSSSGKFDEIFRSLESLVAEKHKVLIFSSFVTHLNLLKTQIEKREWKFSLLTGKTQNRKKVIHNFQNDSGNMIFLISLKAGGVGLNLTAADYVFIIDPWWNPAAELQAISRAHRIGQSKKVIVYRFITEESIEEKIQLLQERKSSLAEKFINSNNPFKAISKEEIINLFS